MVTWLRWYFIFLLRFFEPITEQTISMFTMTVIMFRDCLRLGMKNDANFRLFGPVRFKVPPKGGTLKKSV